MARLPIPGSDEGSWGDILNEYLTTSHQPDGSLKSDAVTSTNLSPGSVATAALQDGSVTIPKLDVDPPASGQVLSYDGTGLSWATPSGSGSVPDATGSVKGLIQLSGDLGGSAAAPTVPGLAGKADASALTSHTSNTTNPHSVTKSQVGLSNVDNTSDANKPISTATQTALNAKATDTAVVHNTGAETVAGVKTFSSSPIVPTPTTATQVANKTYVDSVAGAGAPDASSSVKGIVQLTGDLGGTAASPTVAKVNGISVSGTPSAGQVLKATSSTAASWQADAAGGGSAWTFTSHSANTTIANGQYALVDTTSSGVTITLPVASSGAAVRVKRITGGANSVQIVPQAPALIDGSGVGSHILGNQWDSMEFVSDGTNWYRG